MWVRQSTWDRSVELGVFDRWVITHLPRWAIAHWLEAGFVQVPPERVWQSIRAALAEVQEHEVPALWRCLYEYFPAPPGSRRELERELTCRAREPVLGIIVLERLIERGRRAEPLIWKPWPLPPRSESDHYVVVEAVDPAGQPVSGVQLELLIADGEIKRAQTDAQGVARVERIQAGRVVIRVLGIDGARWKPLDGDAAQPSGAQDGLRWHVAQQGECLSRIADRHGREGWKELWEHPKNAALRKKRKSPHVLLAGDEVALPGASVHEIVRATDATHRIEVAGAGFRKVRLRLQDLGGEPFVGLAYDYGYELAGQGVTKPGSAPTDAHGFLEEMLPLSVDQVEVTLHRSRLRFALRVGALDPAREDDTPVPSGVSMRLSALGYAPGAAAASFTPRTRAALCAFQADALGRAAPDGEVDRETLDALERAYGA